MDLQWEDRVLPQALDARELFKLFVLNKGVANARLYSFVVEVIRYKAKDEAMIQRYPDIVVFQYLPHPWMSIYHWDKARDKAITFNKFKKAPPDAQMPSQNLTAPYVPKDALTTGDKALIFPLSTNHRHTAGDKALVEGATRYPDIPSQYLP
ncbi:hypothetical protein DPMN_133752 [Dreissena polymorpha]|uniref:Uncharacterized protein n=1 Tax=Dreissena polymorpha TaxID=45954 RepID=A0A9D4FU77_DREPO|nr:hypothetical protein DPMN_133752 [Dreissena polymorpha]